MMNLLILKRKDAQEKLIEVFGISRTGKTTTLKGLKAKGEKIISPDDVGFMSKFYNLSKFTLKHPLKTIYLFYKTNTNHITLKELKSIEYLKILSMRNSYLGSALAKSEIIKTLNYERIYTDEFSLQLIFMIYQRKMTKEELQKLLPKLPKANKIIFMWIDKEIRYQRSYIDGFPAQKISNDYAMAWMETMEYNFELIKEVLKESDEYEIIKDTSEWEKIVKESAEHHHQIKKALAHTSEYSPSP